jgi:hypothetical protein
MECIFREQLQSSVERFSGIGMLLEQLPRCPHESFGPNQMLSHEVISRMSSSGVA